MVSTTSQPRNQRVAWKAGKADLQHHQYNFTRQTTPSLPRARTAALRKGKAPGRTYRERNPTLNGAEQSSEYCGGRVYVFGLSGIFFFSRLTAMLGHCRMKVYACLHHILYFLGSSDFCQPKLMLYSTVTLYVPKALQGRTFHACSVRVRRGPHHSSHSCLPLLGLRVIASALSM
jgi:hypothetical protein